MIKRFDLHFLDSFCRYRRCAILKLNRIGRVSPKSGATFDFGTCLVLALQRVKKKYKAYMVDKKPDILYCVGTYVRNRLFFLQNKKKLFLNPKCPCDFA